MQFQKSLLPLLCTLFSISCLGQDTNRQIEFPDIPGFRTLKCDFHIHTVFSDGAVWPSIRVEEALKDGLDAIALTEHLEYQPHEEDIPHPDRNRSFEIAKEQAKAHDLLIIHGAEITRKLPPGHANAIFITDANALNVRDSLEAYRIANQQGAFVFWNHPNWIAQQRNGIATYSDFHSMLVEENLLHGIEVVNDITYSDEALSIAQDHQLTVMGTSDIHGLIDWQFRLDQGGHRPITLVFATTKSEAAIKEALFARRTATWFDNLLIGDEQFLNPLVQNSLHVKKATYQGPSSVVSVEIENQSDASYRLRNVSQYTFHNHADLVEIPAQSVIKLEVKTLTQMPSFSLEFEVLNAIISPNTHPIIAWEVQVDL